MIHSRCIYLSLALFLLPLTWGQRANLLQAARPNVIVIMSDDQGGGDYGFLGNPVIKTPQLDAMFQRS